MIKSAETFKNIAVRQRFSGWSQSAFSDQVFWLFFVAWLVPLLAATGYLAVNFSRLPMEIPLYYSRAWGEAQLATRGYIFLPASGAWLLGIFDFSLAVSLHSQDKVFAYLLCGAAALVAVLTFLTSFNIVNLIG